jgi:hypothetical protein
MDPYLAKGDRNVNGHRLQPDRRLSTAATCGNVRTTVLAYFTTNTGQAANWTMRSARLAITAGITALAMTVATSDE